MRQVGKGRTAEMSSSIGECHRNDAVFTYGPMRHGGYMTAEATYRVDEPDAREVHIMFGELFHGVSVMY